MAQLSDDCFAFGGALLPLADAQSRIADLVSCAVEAGSVKPELGRILAYDVVAAIDLPPQTNSAVDGYAIRHVDLHPDADTWLPIRGRLAAGEGRPSILADGGAMRVFTGAVLPEGADTVMMQEDCEESAEGVLIRPGIRIGSNRRPAGEDVASGEIALRAGRRLSPPDLALLAALGIDRIQVRRPLRVAILSTGNELVDPPSPLAHGRIYDANRPMLCAMVASLGCVVRDCGILPDDVDATAVALGQAADTNDLIITSGGVSTGEEDHVRTALARIGSLAFWRVAIKPGRPVAVGMVGATPMIGLPGNPVAALVTFAALGRPLLDQLGGRHLCSPAASFRCRAGSPTARSWGGGSMCGCNSAATASPGASPRKGAGIITSLTRSDALMELPEHMTHAWLPGDLAPCIPLALLHG